MFFQLPSLQVSWLLLLFLDYTLFVCSEMSSAQEDQEELDVNSGCARKPGAISEADVSDAVDASDTKTLANEDKPVGSTTASDAASSLTGLVVRSHICAHSNYKPPCELAISRDIEN